MSGTPNWSRTARRTGGRPTKTAKVYDLVCAARREVAETVTTGPALTALGRALDHLDEAEQLQGNLVVSEAGRQGG